jgi:hypothetical protein
MAFGHRFTVDSDDESLRESLEPLLSGFPVHALGDDCAEYELLTTESGCRLRIAGTTSFEGTPSACLNHLLVEIEMRALESYAGHHLLVHAGAVMIGGGVVLLVGETGAGKTTLVCELARRGMPLLSDEQVAFAPGVGVQGLARSLRVKDGLGGVTRVPIPEVADSVVCGWRPLRAICLLDRAYQHEAHLSPAHPGEVALSVGRNSSYLYELTHPAGALAALVTGVPGFVLRYREASDAAALLIAAVA